MDLHRVPCSTSRQDCIPLHDLHVQCPAIAATLLGMSHCHVLWGPYWRPHTYVHCKIAGVHLGWGMAAKAVGLPAFSAVVCYLVSAECLLRCLGSW